MFRHDAEMATTSLRTVFRIAKAWRLTPQQVHQLLGSPSRSSFCRWKAGNVGRVPSGLLERLSYVLGIYKSLQLLLPDPALADAWVRRPNDAPLFAGQPPLDRMLGGLISGLFVVCDHLDRELIGE